MPVPIWEGYMPSTLIWPLPSSLFAICITTTQCLSGGVGVSFTACKMATPHLWIFKYLFEQSFDIGHTQTCIMSIAVTCVVHHNSCYFIIFCRTFCWSRENHTHFIHSPRCNVVYLYIPGLAGDHGDAHVTADCSSHIIWWCHHLQCLDICIQLSKPIIFFRLHNSSWGQIITKYKNKYGLHVILLNRHISQLH